MNYYGLIFSAVLSLAFLGCSQESGKEQAAEQKEQQKPAETSEEAVTRRANERWKYLVDTDYAKAYEYFSPGGRATLSLKSFRKSMSNRVLEWTGGKVNSAACEETICRVKIDLTYLYQGYVEAMQGQESTSVIDENWVLSEGEWWYVPL